MLQERLKRYKKKRLQQVNILRTPFFPGHIQASASVDYCGKKHQLNPFVSNAHFLYPLSRQRVHLERMGY